MFFITYALQNIVWCKSVSCTKKEKKRHVVLLLRQFLFSSWKSFWHKLLYFINLRQFRFVLFWSPVLVFHQYLMFKFEVLKLLKYVILKRIFDKICCYPPTPHCVHTVFDSLHNIVGKIGRTENNSNHPYRWPISVSVEYWWWHIVC